MNLISILAMNIRLLNNSFKLLCFQYSCEYGAEYSGYHLEPNNEALYKDMEILDEASVDEAQPEELIYNEDLI
ncbi:10183_t:CDS:2 [Cetraspora pellucida]|uniref:10183_t:CDS:1 n=1 Tax=Cetraspora pellucida TaxID=1433469 RepID=A0A9N9I0V3_9GLOM|nr:10183_t:CDS:2 [Cetraspora pellucida]